MIGCFNNLVGVRTNCGTQTASDSGLYLQNLSFINLKTADAVLTSQDSGIDLLNDKIGMATEYLLNDARSIMFPYFKNKSIIENMNAGYYIDNRTIENGISGSYKGIQLKVSEYPYLSVFLSSLSLFVDYTGSVPIVVIDLIQGKVLDTINVSAVAGEIVNVDIFKKYETNGQILNLFIGYNSSAINSYTSYIYSQGFRGYVGCRDCVAPRSYGNQFVMMYSKSLPISSTKLENDLDSANDTGGLSINYSLQCSLTKWLCRNRDAFAMPLLHRAGMEVLTEVKMSNRLNTLVVLKKDEVDTLYAYFEQEYKKGMDNVFKNLRLPDDICFECDKKILNSVVKV